MLRFSSSTRFDLGPSEMGGRRERIWRSGVRDAIKLGRSPNASMGASAIASLAALRLEPRKLSLRRATRPAGWAAKAPTASGATGGSYSSTSVVRRIWYVWPAAAIRRVDTVAVGRVNDIAVTTDSLAGMPTAGGVSAKHGVSLRPCVPGLS